MNYIEQLTEIKQNINDLDTDYKAFCRNIKKWNTKEPIDLKNQIEGRLDKIKSIYKKNKTVPSLIKKLGDKVENYINSFDLFINNFNEIISEADLLNKDLNIKSPSQLYLDNKKLYQEKIEPLIKEINEDLFCEIKEHKYIT